MLALRNPSGVPMSATIEPLTNGQTGLHLKVPQSALVAVCTRDFRASTPILVEATLRVASVGRGEGEWQRLDIEERWLDRGGQVIRGADGLPVAERRFFDAPTPWDTHTWTATPPPGAVMARLCVRFAQATGELELSRLAVRPAP